MSDDLPGRTSSSSSSPLSSQASSSSSSWSEQLEALFERPDEVPEDRRHTLEGMLAMQRGDLKLATTLFRRALRRDAEPFKSLSAVALGECLRLEGKGGAALKTWRALTKDPDASAAQRYGAWLGVARLAEERQDAREIEQARRALELLDAELSQELA